MNEEKISNLIKKIRKDNNLSQKEFANLFGVTYQAVSKWENGKNIPDISIIKEICKKYNISMDEFLDTGIKKNNIKKYLVFGIIFIIIITVVLFFIFQNNDFEFKMISANCEDFKVTGSIAYNQNKTSIYISEIYYCGNEEEIKYDNIDCNLYEDNGNIKKLIEKCKRKEDITLYDFVNSLSFHIDNYNAICKKYNDNNLYLEIDAYKNNKIKSYKIPLKVNSNCNKKIVLD